METIEDINIIPKLITYINQKHLYRNIFLYIKLCHLQFYSQKDNRNHFHIPLNLINLFSHKPKNLTIWDISGGNEISDKWDDQYLPPLNIIYIPEYIISNFFIQNQTICGKENSFILNKMDLYFSILTYIYAFSLTSKMEIQDNICLYLKEFLQTLEKEKETIKHQIIYSLYNSTIYDFSEIPDTVESFPYEYHSSKIDIFDHLDKYGHCNENETDNLNYVDCAFHHLITISKFYNEYLLSCCLLNKYSPIYQNHPLEIIARTVDNKNKY